VARTWLSIRVDLISGHGEELWPRPGRIFAAARSHKFSQLADAIDTAFARWDRSHLYKFELGDGRLIGQAEFDDFDLGFIDGAATTLSTLALGEQFVYEFDFGDSWTHLCTVGPARIDPESEVGIVPRSPLPYWGWGAIPDQYGRRWDGDDGESPEPPNPGLTDLPPLQPWWGPQARP
jgi:Plasmid pRiA4b ORF-3-like protein